MFVIKHQETPYNETAAANDSQVYVPSSRRFSSLIISETSCFPTSAKLSGSDIPPTSYDDSCDVELDSGISTSLDSSQFSQSFIIFSTDFISSFAFVKSSISISSSTTLCKLLVHLTSSFSLLPFFKSCSSNSSIVTVFCISSKICGVDLIHNKKLPLSAARTNLLVHKFMIVLFVLPIIVLKFNRVKLDAAPSEEIIMVQKSASKLIFLLETTATYLFKNLTMLLYLLILFLLISFKVFPFNSSNSLRNGIANSTMRDLQITE
jgi:hypothetical protein